MSVVSKNIWYSSRAKQTTNDLAVTLEGESLLISYRPGTTNSFCDISDRNGKILLTQSLQEDGITKISILFLRKGPYKLTIVDGQDMMKLNLSID